MGYMPLYTERSTIGRDQRRAYEVKRVRTSWKWQNDRNLASANAGSMQEACCSTRSYRGLPYMSRRHVLSIQVKSYVNLLTPQQAMR